MNDPHGGPPGRGYGPGQTVLGQPAYPEQAPSGPPATVRDPAAAPPDAALPPAIIPPPPPPARARRGRGGGPPLAIIGVGAFVVIGGALTALVVISRSTGDDKPVPTIDVPSATVAPDPGPPGAATDPPAPTDPPPTPPPQKRPYLPRPGTYPRPAPHPGPPHNPRYPPPPPKRPK